MRNSGSIEGDGSQLVSAESYGSLPDVGSRRDRALDIGMSQDDMTSGAVSQEEIAAALAKSMADQFTPTPAVNPTGWPSSTWDASRWNATSRDAASRSATFRASSQWNASRSSTKIRTKITTTCSTTCPTNCSIDNNSSYSTSASSHWSASWLVNGAMERLRSNVAR